jgi:ferredoxin
MWAPDIFELDDLGYACVATATVAGPLLDAARRGAAGCPERAITIVEEV